jgi:hypothetical protein
VQVEAEKREIETEEHLKIMADKEIVRLAAAALLSAQLHREQQQAAAIASPDVSDIHADILQLHGAVQLCGAHHRPCQQRHCNNGQHAHAAR